MSTVPDPVDRTVERLRAVCAGAVETLSASGAGVSVLVQDGQYSLLTGADAASERLEEMQFVLGEGPCVDAKATGRPVLVSDLADESPGRWPLYAPAMHEAGIRAIFAFPLQVGAARIGALDIFRARPGPLSRTELISAFQMADEAVSILLALEISATNPEPFTHDEDGADSVELFQAQGMVMVQLDGTLSQAMARIRAYSYAENRRLVDVVRDIVERRLRFDKDE